MTIADLQQAVAGQQYVEQNTRKDESCPDIRKKNDDNSEQLPPAWNANRKELRPAGMAEIRAGITAAIAP